MTLPFLVTKDVPRNDIAGAKCASRCVLGIDGAYPLLKGKRPPVLIAVDLGHGQPVAIGQVDESNPQAVRRWVEPLVQRLGLV
jgi:hypothetical protein